MIKTLTMSQKKISTIPVDTVCDVSALQPITLMTFGDFTASQREARWNSDGFCGTRNEKLGDKVYVWTPSKKGGTSLGTTLRSKFSAVPTDAIAERPIDVHRVLQQFFEISEPEQALRLFNQYGIFGREHQNIFSFQMALSFADLLDWQDLLRECRLAEPNDWKALSQKYGHLRESSKILDAPEIVIPLKSPIKISLRCACVRDAIMAAIYLDKLANVKASTCYRPDCGAVFNHESGHKRKYCTPECGHLVAVRNERKRKADGKSQAANNPSNRAQRR